MSFWEGFFKQASLGEKALKPLSQAGRMVGNKPATGVAMAAHFKPTPLPTPTPHAAAHNLQAALPVQASGRPRVAKRTSMGPAEMHV